MSEMKKYRYIGPDPSTVGGLTYRIFGGLFTFEEDFATALIAADPPAFFLPEELFDELGFTDDELASYPSRATHNQAPPEFQAKVKAATLAFHAYREGLRAQAV